MKTAEDRAISAVTERIRADQTRAIQEAVEAERQLYREAAAKASQIRDDKDAESALCFLISICSPVSPMPEDIEWARKRAVNIRPMADVISEAVEAEQRAREEFRSALVMYANHVMEDGFTIEQIRSDLIEIAGNPVSARGKESE